MNRKKTSSISSSTLPFNLLTGIVFLLLLTAACGDNRSQTEEPAQAPFEAFFDALAEQCGNAYPGGLTLEPEGDEMLTGTELLIVHFRECGESRLKMPFHIEIEEDDSWDRSRTWIFIKHDDGLEIRHDHRKPDGSDDDVTMYGGFSVGEGTAYRQEFKSVPRSEETGMFRGWRIEIVPGERYTYGTIRDTTWSWRVDFDLEEPIDPPPAPWGHEDPSR